MPGECDGIMAERTGKKRPKALFLKKRHQLPQGRKNGFSGGAGRSDARHAEMTGDAGQAFFFSPEAAGDFSLLPVSTSPGFALAPLCTMRLPSGTLCVSQTLPPMTEPLPMVMRPRMEAPAYL